jgi:hypothetical protein
MIDQYSIGKYLNNENVIKELGVPAKGIYKMPLVGKVNEMVEKYFQKENLEMEAPVLVGNQIVISIYDGTKTIDTLYIDIKEFVYNVVKESTFDD